jgi:hypothetical protein
MAIKQDNPPDRWLQGACLRLERQGLTSREAIAQAVSEWREQGLAAAKHDALNAVRDHANEWLDTEKRIAN